MGSRPSQHQGQRRRSDQTASRSRRALPGRLAWLPVLLFLIAVVALRAAHLRAEYQSPLLAMVLNFLTRALASLLVVFLAGRGFLVRGTPGLLLLGCGVAIWGAAGLVTTAVVGRDANLSVTISNLGAWLSALCHLTGVALSFRPGLTVRATGLWLAVGYALAFGAVALVTLATLAGQLPVFFVEDQGGTLIRYLVLASAIAMFIVAAMLLRMAKRSSSSSFTRWYAYALLLIATALFGNMIESSRNTALDWTCRGAQYLGGVYLLIAAIAAVRETRAWEIPLAEALRETEAELREAQRVARVGNWYWDVETDAVTASEQVYRMLGLDPRLPIPVLREREWQLYTPESQARVREAVQKAIRFGVGYTLDVEARRADGTPLWITARAEAVRGDDGRTVGLRGTNQDITERKRAEQGRERLHEQADQQARLLDTIVGATDSRLAYLDRELRYVRVNAAYAAAARMAPEQFVGRHRLEVFPNAPEVAAMYQRVLDTGEPSMIAEYTGVPLYRPEVGPRTVRIEATPTRNERGEVDGIVTSLVDITELVEERQRAVAAERARAEIAERISDEIDHRVKNNLAMVSGLLQMQVLSATDEEAAEALRAAVARIRVFMDIHEQMYAAGTDRLDLLEAVQRIATSTRQVFAVGRVEIVVEGEPARCPSKLATSLSVVANELITNALKHGGPDADGVLRVKVKVAPDGERICLSVWNSGQPVPADFDLLRQGRMGMRLVAASVTEEHGGTFALAPEEGGTRATASVTIGETTSV